MPLISSTVYERNSLLVYTHISDATFIALSATSSALMSSTLINALAAAILLSKFIHFEKKVGFEKVETNVSNIATQYSILDDISTVLTTFI